MTLALLCGTRRGLAVLQEVQRLLPPDEVRVVTYPEARGEPRFTDDVVATASSAGSRVEVATRPHGPGWEWLWDDLDLALMVHWRSMLPMTALNRARRGALVMHDSLLPAYRGFSPTVWAMVNGETRCGVTLFHAAEEVDTGDVVDQRAVDVAPDATIADVVDDVTDAYVAVVRRSLMPLLAGTAPRKPQDHAAATYACKRTRDDDRLDWSASTQRVLDMVRALTRPYQGAWTLLGEERCTVWAASPALQGRRWVRQVPGRVVEVRRGEGVIVMTGDGAVLVRTLSIGDAAPQPAADVLRTLTTTLR